MTFPQYIENKYTTKSKNKYKVIIKMSLLNNYDTNVQS